MISIRIKINVRINIAVTLRALYKKVTLVRNLLFFSDKVGQITTIIKDQVERLSIMYSDSLKFLTSLLVNSNQCSKHCEH